MNGNRSIALGFLIVGTIAGLVGYFHARKIVKNSPSVDYDTSQNKRVNLVEEKRRLNLSKHLEKSDLLRAGERFNEICEKWTLPGAYSHDTTAVRQFVATFLDIPTNQRKEFLQRALNVLPDENVAPLKAILINKSLPPDISEMIFYNMMKRCECVKKSVLAMIYADKEHPCWPKAKWLIETSGFLKARH